MEILRVKKSMTLKELLDALEKLYGSISMSLLNKALMKLEIRGFIHVSSLTKGEKQIELIEEKP